MDLHKKMQENSVNYKISLDRIIDKYSKLQYQDGGIEVDLETIKTPRLEYCMNVSKLQLNKLESQSLTSLREESFKAHDVTRNSELDFTHHAVGADETSSTKTTRSDPNQLTVSSLDESQGNFSETELTPEDQDEELNMTLRSNGSTLVELYPSMVSRIERAWHRRNVSEAADSVLRRYRKWRQQSNTSNLHSTFSVTLRHTNSNDKPKIMTDRMLFKENFKKRRQLTRTEPAHLSPLQTVSNLQLLEAEQSPGRKRISQRGGQHKPILIMDLSDISKPQEISLNETFTVSELTQLSEQPSTFPASPSRPCYLTAKASSDRPLWYKRLSYTPQLEQAPGCSTFASETTGVKEKPDIYSSPVRQSPLKVRKVTSPSGSPHGLCGSPKDCVKSFSRWTVKPRSLCRSLSSSPQESNRDKRVLNPPDSRHSLQPQQRSPYTATAGRVRLRRHLSFDSSQPSFNTSYSPEMIDEYLKKFYHKFVCQNKSFFSNGPPCRLCGRSAEASRGHSSSALAALALSPHRSLLRKRHRELVEDYQPQSKRYREEYYGSSPGSKRHGREMLRHLEQTREDFSHSSSKGSMFLNVCTQQRSADAHQEALVNRGRPFSSAQFSGLGGMLGSVANRYSPRKW